MEVTKVIHQCETCSHHSSFLNIQGKQGEWQPICKADENPYKDGYCPRYDKYERSQKMIKNTQTNPLGGGA